MEKYLINILKDKDFDEIVIGDACIYKEGEYFIVSASYSEYKLSKKLYRYLKLNGLNTKVRIADNKTPNKKKIDKLYQGIPKKDISFLFYAADGIFSIYDYEGLTEVQNLVNYYKSFDSNLVDNNILIKREDNYNYFLLNVKQVNREYYNFLDSEFFSKVKSYMKLNSKKNKYNLTSAFENVFDVRLNRNEMVEMAKNFRNQEVILKALVRVRKQEGYSEFDTIRSLHRYLRENIPNTKKIYARKVRDIVKENY